MIKLTQISKTYDKKKVLNKLSLSISTEKITFLLGSNGSGKSTLISIIVGLISKDEGSIALRDLKESDIHLASEALNLPESFITKDAIQYFSKLKNVEEKQVKYWQEKLGLLEHLNKKIKTLSQGNRQKLNLLLCFLGQPKFVILDEPYNGLDPNAIILLRSILKELKQNGIGILVSSHLLKEAEDVYEEVIILQEGNLLLQASKEEVQENYASLEDAYQAKSLMP